MAYRTDTDTPQPQGTYTFAEYRALEAVNWSSLRILGQSPLHYRAALTAPDEDTGPLIFGRAAHVAVLEPDSFDSQYICWGGGYTAAGKPTQSRMSRDYKDWAEQNQDKEHLTQDELSRVYRVAGAVMGHRTAGELLRGAQTEQTAIWTDPVTGLKCKGRVDIIASNGRLADLKTTSNADPVEFGKSVVKFGYAGQLAWYLDGAVAAGLDVDQDQDPAIVAVESKPPHDVVVYRIGPQVLEYGRKLYRELIVRLAACQEANSWPGYCAEGEIDLCLPAWATTTTIKKAS